MAISHVCDQTFVSLLDLKHINKSNLEVKKNHCRTVREFGEGGKVKMKHRGRGVSISYKVFPIN